MWYNYPSLAYIQGIISVHQWDSCMPVFTAVLFIITKNGINLDKENMYMYIW
jgi:hypothetical protein